MNLNASSTEAATTRCRHRRIFQLSYCFAHAPGRLLRYFQGFRGPWSGFQLRNDQDIHSPSKDNCSPKDLICENCWVNVFSTEGFYRMRQVSSSDDTWYKEGGLKYRTLPWATLQRDATRCHFCNMVYTAISHCSEVLPSAEREFLVTVGLRLVNTGQYSPHPFEIMTFVVDDGDVVPDSQDYTICTTDDDVASAYIKTRGPPASADKEVNIACALRCIDTCSYHEACPHPTPSQLPTRVLDCINPERLCLVTTDPSSQQFYAALSYVWGESQTHQTTTQNIEAYHAVIEFHRIPKTIRDAVIVTKRLGLRYLWIDSFCIMQDSDEDKDLEIEKMQIYYRNAFVTIIAANAERVSEGFLHDSPKWCPPKAPITLPFRSPDGLLGTMFLHRTYEEWPTLDQPVDKRAWCMGERVLSPRRLLFCSHALQYECQMMRVNVNDSPLGLPDIYPRLPNSVFTSVKVNSESEEAELVNEWDVVVYHYTRRKLTMEKDKLVAISAVAKQFQQPWPESRYIAGLWSHQLPDALLWYMVQNDHSGSGAPERARFPPPPIVYRAPSWSWASVIGTVDTYRKVPHAKTVAGFCTVKHCEATPKRKTNPYGEVTAGLLTLQASTMAVMWTPRESTSNNIYQRAILEDLTIDQPQDSSNADAKTVAIGDLNPDSSEFIEQESCNVVLVGVQKSTRAVFGLALVVADATALDIGIVYRRIGWVRVGAEHWRSNSSIIVHII